MKSFLGIKRAYDSVPTNAIQKALERIDLPKEVIELIMNIYRNRHMKVRTCFGYSSGFKEHNGIDQGDSISPLIWNIFYDMLLAKLSKMEKGTYRNTSHLLTI